MIRQVTILAATLLVGTSFPYHSCLSQSSSDKAVNIKSQEITTFNEGSPFYPNGVEMPVSVDMLGDNLLMVNYQNGNVIQTKIANGKSTIHQPLSLLVNKYNEELQGVQNICSNEYGFILGFLRGFVIADKEGKQSFIHKSDQNIDFNGFGSANTVLSFESKTINVFSQSGDVLFNHTLDFIPEKVFYSNGKTYLISQNRLLEILINESNQSIELEPQLTFPDKILEKMFVSDIVSSSVCLFDYYIREHMVLLDFSSSKHNQVSRLNLVGTPFRFNQEDIENEYGVPNFQLLIDDESSSLIAVAFVGSKLELRKISINDQ